MSISSNKVEQKRKLPTMVTIPVTILIDIPEGDEVSNEQIIEFIRKRFKAKIDTAYGMNFGFSNAKVTDLHIRWDKMNITRN